MQTSEIIPENQNPIYLFCRFLWRTVGLRRILWLRSFWAFVNRVWLIISEDTTRAKPYFEELYREKADPWDYLRIAQQARYQQASQSIARVCQPQKIATALEIGCSEGMFTALLADCCENLLAVDISTVALDRAQARCADLPQVKFKQWDLSKDRLDGKFDVVTIMDVLEYFYRPASLRGVRDKIVELVKPGGHLLVTVSKTHDFVENARWSRWLYCGKHSMSLIAAHPDLILCESVELELHVLALFRRR